MDAVNVVSVDSSAVWMVLIERPSCVETNGSCTRPLYGVALVGEDSIGLSTIADGNSLEGVSLLWGEIRTIKTHKCLAWV